MTAEDPGAANMVATHRKTFSAAVADGLKDAITSGGLHVGNVPLDKLTQDPDNPKTHSERNYRAIAASLSEHGQVSPLVVQCSTGIIIAGNATALSMASLGMTHADVVLIDVDDKERRRIAVRMNRTSELGGWDVSVLKAAMDEWDGDYTDLWDAKEAVALFESDDSDGNGADDTYTLKLEAPVYEPKMAAPPPVAALCDDTKTAELVAAINGSDLPDEVAGFLTLAAERHTRFNFRAIAEFYCHAEPDVQRLMEDSGLVIIDFDAALEAGFVKLTERLADLVGVENWTRDA